MLATTWAATYATLRLVSDRTIAAYGELSTFVSEHHALVSEVALDPRDANEPVRIYTRR